MAFPSIKRRSTEDQQVLVADPQEVREGWLFRSLIVVAAPVLLLALYHWRMFPGLTNSDALDFAQLGRNLSSGHGFTTYILRPLALSHGANPLAQPDVTHGPLYPLALAAAFGAFGAHDSVVAWVSGLFYLLTLPLIYALGKRAFSRTVGIYSVVIFALSGLMLEYAISGLPITLTIFLTTALLFNIHQLASEVGGASDPEARVPRGRIALIAVLAAALYLTDFLFVWLLPVTLAAVMSLCRQRRSMAVLVFCGVVALLVLPSMVRNTLLAGNPVFGLRGKELWMNSSIYPGFSGYRLNPGELAGNLELARALVKKVLLGIGGFLQSFPQLSVVWILAFFLPSLFVRFRDPAALVLRRALIGAFGALLLGSLLFGLQLPTFTAFVPCLLVFSVAYITHLMSQAKLERPALVGSMALLGLVTVYPLLSDAFLGARPQPLADAAAAKSLAKLSSRDHLVFSDQPWVVAWHASRPSVWLPAREEQMPALRRRFAGEQWLFLTEQSSRAGRGWSWVHEQLRGVNLRYAEEVQAGRKPTWSVRVDSEKLPEPVRKAFPLVGDLGSIVWVPPVEGSPLTTVVASLPQRRA